MCSMQENRGVVVQQGGVKALLGLAAEGTSKGKVTAAHALARIAITINPEVAFPGQRVSVAMVMFTLFSSSILSSSRPIYSVIIYLNAINSATDSNQCNY